MRGSTTSAPAIFARPASLAVRGARSGRADSRRKAGERQIGSQNTDADES
jgi:hypothetical protein